MADTVTAPPVTAAVSTAGGSGPVAVTVSADAAAAQVLDKLADGAVLEGTAATRAVKGAVEIATTDGSLQIKVQLGMTLPAFPPGAKLTLQMVGNGANGQLFLVAVNGRPLAGLGTLNPTSTIPGLTLPLPPGPGLSSPQPQGQGSTLAAAAPFGVVPASAAPPTSPLGLSATIIRPAQAAGESVQTDHKPPAVVAGVPPDLPPGTRLTVRIAGVVLPDGGGDGLDGLPPLPPGSVSPGNPAGPSAVPPRPALPGQPQQGGGLTPQITIPDASQSSARLLPGSVIAHPPGGQAVVQTQIGTLSVPTYAALPPGTQLTLEVVGQPLPPLPPPLPPSATAASGLGAQGWPVLSQALDVLTNANQPQALEQLLRVMPQPDARLAASMVAFSGALRSGDVRSLLPDNSVRGLEKAGRKDVASRLKADLEGLAEEAGRPLGNGDWRLYTMPMLGGGAIEPIRLYVRKGSGDEGGKGAGNQASDHRFVVDLNLTQLGRLQLDGLVRRQDKLFDLIIRTEAALDQDIRRDILGIFTNASELVGTKGTVSFQAGGRWMEFPPAPPAPTRIEV